MQTKETFGLDCIFSFSLLNILLLFSNQKTKFTHPYKKTYRWVGLNGLAMLLQSLH